MIFEQFKDRLLELQPVINDYNVVISHIGGSNDNPPTADVVRITIDHEWKELILEVS